MILKPAFGIKILDSFTKAVNECQTDIKVDETGVCEK